MSDYKTAKKVPGFECRICHKAFVGPKAEQKALDCQALGKPKHNYRVGKKFLARVGGLGKNQRTLLKIIGCKIVYHPDHKTHEVAYQLVIDSTGEEMGHWYYESEITREINQVPNPC